MKNRKGFTLIELLAVVVILGVIMMIAVPNTIALIDKNKKTSYIEGAKTFVSLVQNKLQTDKSLELPTTSTTASIVNLKYLNTNDIDESPYGDHYDKDLSFVAVTLENNKYVYYVHLVSCMEKTPCDTSIYQNWHGIDLVEVSRLNDDDRYELVKSSGVIADLINNVEANKYLQGKTLYKYGLD